MPPPATKLFGNVFHFESKSLTSSAKHWTINQVWPRLVQERIGSVGFRGGRDWAAGICDEGKPPHCKRCSSLGVLCNFMSNILDLHPIAATTRRLLVVRGKAEIQPPIKSAVSTSDKSTSYQLNAKCQDFITPDDPDMYVNRKLLRLAFAISIII
ncbi:hypothetical protein N7478_009131 [Penicillium angulare]|uniref:uncharacterized protein n=1 Tax=Penicillium angulare TaxID=116970 RepID=UPI002540AC00|nr:uncharacterized protein N7478_009131 [Penicillium angulare]KAJ5274006.1 hypothetical protein N7478_009131 [Penicillium angulare]